MDKLAALNDEFRKSILTLPNANGLVLLTAGVSDLPSDTKSQIIMEVKKFTDFNQDNDPWKEHDCASVKALDGTEAFFKIDYFEDKRCSVGAEDPLTAYRVLTIGLWSEW